jgi:hypothetical protein
MNFSMIFFEKNGRVTTLLCGEILRNKNFLKKHDKKNENTQQILKL